MHRYLGSQCFIVNDRYRLKIMREESDIYKPLENILTLQSIDKNKNIEEDRTDLIDKAPAAAESFFLRNNNDVNKIKKNEIGGILSY